MSGGKVGGVSDGWRPPGQLAPRCPLELCCYPARAAPPLNARTVLSSTGGRQGGGPDGAAQAAGRSGRPPGAGRRLPASHRIAAPCAGGVGRAAAKLRWPTPAANCAGLWRVEQVGGAREGGASDRGRSASRTGSGVRKSRTSQAREWGEASGSSGGSLWPLVGEGPCWVRESRDRRRRPGRSRPPPAAIAPAASAP